MVRNEDWTPEAPVPDAVIDEHRARFLADAVGADPGVVRRRLDDTHARLRAALAGLAVPSAGAKRAFGASTAEHYAEHLQALREAGRIAPAG